jgi:tetratricopeptide (TPR) repeat protein
METEPMRVNPQMLRGRDVRFAVDSPDLLLRLAREHLSQIEQWRGCPPEQWPSPRALPRMLDSLATTLRDLGWPDLARLAYLEALALYRKLDRAKSTDARRTVTALRATLVELHLYEEALPVVREELRLAKAHRSGREEARTARYWLTSILDKTGRNEEALESAFAAVRELRLGEPRRYDLAHALTEYANQLSRAGRFADAIPVTEEVVTLWRGHGDVPCAEALGQLGWRLARVCRYEEALTAWAEAVKVLRAEGYDRLRLANGLHNYSLQLSSLGSYRKALSASEEAAALYREFVERQRQRHLQVEAGGSGEDDHRLSERHLRQRRQEQLDESQAQVRVAEMRLCNELINLGVRLQVFHRADEALTVNAEALAIARAHLDAEPGGSPPSLVLALNNRSVLLDHLGRYPEALAAASEAVALSGRTDAVALHTYSVAASHAGQHDEALTASLETIDAYRRAYESDPYTFASKVAAALTDHGRIRSRRGEHAEAFTATTESVELYRRLAEQNPGRYGAGCAHALLVFAEVRLAANNSLTEGRLAANNSLTEGRLAANNSLTDGRLAANNSLTAGRAAAEEAVARYQRLAGDLSEAYTPDLARAQSLLNRD